MKVRPVISLLTLTTAQLALGQVPVELPQLTVYSLRVANQAPVGTFAMPVSALRYEPGVDIQGRNLVEGQADVTIRGGIFENTGFRVGTVSLLDPQTGHYFAEIPISPAMLGALNVLSGADLAAGTTNATTGAVTYGWRPIRTAGMAQTAAGPHGLLRGEVYQGFAAPESLAGRLAADVDYGHSESNGSIAFGDHHFNRVNARLQRTADGAQTDAFVGYQAKFYGWPNLYTPFNSRESENLQTLLVAVNHRVDLGNGDFVAAGVSHRRNKDDYAFDRFAPTSRNHPFQHTTWQDAAALEARHEYLGLDWYGRAEVLADDLKSTSLTAGRYHSRTLAKFSFVPEKTWMLASGDAVSLKAGMTYDDSNRDGGAVSPVFQASRTFAQAPLRRIYLSYAEATQQPTYTALNSNANSGLFRGNPNLGRETARNAEIGARASLSGWDASAAFFARRDDNLVDWTFLRGVTARSANAVDIDTLGFETVVRRSWSVVDLVLGYTALTKRPDYGIARVDASFYALNYARHRVTAAATVRLGAGFELRLDNVARIQAANFLRTVGGDEAVLSTAALAYRPSFVRGLELTAQVDNVWASRFQEVPAVPASPRGWSVGANYIW